MPVFTKYCFQYIFGYRRVFIRVFESIKHEHELGSRSSYGNIKSVQSTLSHLISTSVPRATFTRFFVEHGSFQYYLY